MTDIEKVIENLEQMLSNYDMLDDIVINKNNEMLMFHRAVAKAALELLKEQQGHDGSFIVVDTHTGKEADVYNIALHEDWAKHLCYCDMDGWAIQDDGSLLLLDECGRYAYADRERFKVVWDA